MGTKDKKIDQLNQLIDHYSEGNKSKFAELIGISPQGLNNWFKRGTFDVELLFNKFDDLSPEWLLTGEGNMFSTTNEDKDMGKSTIKQNISRYLDYKGISDYQFYKESGVSRGVLSQNNGLSEDNLMRFLNYYSDVNPSWVVTGKGNMLTNVSKSEITPIHTPKAVEKVLEEQAVPLFSFEATAGIFEQLDNSAQYQVGEIIIPGLPRCDGAVRITGDSMYPILKSGDIVIFTQVHNFSDIFYGEMYLLSICINDNEQYITVKYVQNSELEDHIKLISYNTHHAPKDIPLSSVQAMALVKASIRYNTMA